MDILVNHPNFYEYRCEVNHINKTTWRIPPSIDYTLLRKVYRDAKIHPYFGVFMEHLKILRTLFELISEKLIEGYKVQIGYIGALQCTEQFIELHSLKAFKITKKLGRKGVPTLHYYRCLSPVEFKASNGLKKKMFKAYEEGALYHQREQLTLKKKKDEL